MQQIDRYINKKRVVQLGLGLFGTCSLYLIYGILYQKTIMSSYQDINTKDKEYFKSSTGFIFLKNLFTWAIAELITTIFCQKQQKKNLIKNKHIIICSFLICLSGILFTEGIYYTSFRLSFVIRCSAFFASSLFGFIFSPLKNKLNNPKIKDIFIGLGILGGMVLFWVYDTEICFYVPVKPGIISVVIIVVSVICQALLSIFQAEFKQQYQPTSTLMMINIQRGTLILSTIFCLISGQLIQTLKFTASHPEFCLDLITMSIISFLGQLFIYRLIIQMQMNTASFVTSSRKVLTVTVSFLFTVHPFQRNQIIGLTVALVFVVIGIICIVRQQSGNDSIKGKRRNYSYSTVGQIASEQI